MTRNEKTHQAGERTQHTPGPWRVKDKRGDAFAHGVFVCWGEGNMVIAKVSFGEAMYRPEGKPEANARLIAASPELYGALEHFFNIMHDYESSLQKGYVQHAMDMARAALESAKGSAI